MGVDLNSLTGNLNKVINKASKAIDKAGEGNSNSTSQTNSAAEGETFSFGKQGVVQASFANGTVWNQAGVGTHRTGVTTAGGGGSSTPTSTPTNNETKMPDLSSLNNLFQGSGDGNGINTENLTLSDYDTKPAETALTNVNSAISNWGDSTDNVIGGTRTETSWNALQTTGTEAKSQASAMQTAVTQSNAQIQSAQQGLAQMQADVTNITDLTEQELSDAIDNVKTTKSDGDTKTKEAKDSKEAASKKADAAKTQSEQAADKADKTKEALETSEGDKTKAEKSDAQAKKILTGAVNKRNSAKQALSKAESEPMPSKDDPDYQKKCEAREKRIESAKKALEDAEKELKDAEKNAGITEDQLTEALKNVKQARQANDEAVEMKQVSMDDVKEFEAKADKAETDYIDTMDAANEAVKLAEAHETDAKQKLEKVNADAQKAFEVKDNVEAQISAMKQKNATVTSQLIPQLADRGDRALKLHDHWTPTEAKAELKTLGENKNDVSVDRQGKVREENDSDTVKAFDRSLQNDLNKKDAAGTKTTKDVVNTIQYGNKQASRIIDQAQRKLQSGVALSKTEYETLKEVTTYQKNVTNMNPNTKAQIANDAMFKTTERQYQTLQRLVNEQERRLAEAKAPAKPAETTEA